MRCGLSLALVLSIPLGAGPAIAEEWRLELDPALTEVTFELDATLHTVHGTARLTEGTIVFDPESSRASGRIVVDATSAETAKEGRDRTMHRKVLESGTHDEIVFVPERFVGDFDPEGESRVTLEGSFAIHGAEHALSVEVSTRVIDGLLEAELEFTVPYVAWGMKNPSKLLVRVSKEVQVRIRGVGRLERTTGEPRSPR